MTTETDIVNRALAAIASRASVANLDENSNEARTARMLYAPTRDAMLRAAHWNFCRKTAYLSLLKAAPGTPENTSTSTTWTPAMPAPPWLYEYDYPADCLMVRYITPQVETAGGLATPIFSVPSYGPPMAVGPTPVRFVVSTDEITVGQPQNVILTNQQQAIGVYTAQITNPALWDAMFQEAMVAALGSRFAFTITGKPTVAKNQAQAAFQAIQQARAQDGNEGFTSVDHTPDWIAVRGYVGSWSTPASGLVNGWSTPSFLLL